MPTIKHQSPRSPLLGISILAGIWAAVTIAAWLCLNVPRRPFGGDEFVRYDTSLLDVLAGQWDAITALWGWIITLRIW